MKTRYVWVFSMAGVLFVSLSLVGGMPTGGYPTDGLGGSVGKGGATGAGGVTGAGGAEGKGGATGSGGATGKGGATGSGGAQGTGGTVGTGGSMTTTTTSPRPAGGNNPTDARIISPPDGPAIRLDAPVFTRPEAGTSKDAASTTRLDVGTIRLDAR